MATYLRKAFSTTGNRQKFSLSMWVKRASGLGVEQMLCECYSGSSAKDEIWLQTNNTINFVTSNPDGLATTSSAEFKDASSWYHFLFAGDSTQASNANRIKIYKNGVQQALAQQDTIPQNQNFQFGNTGTELTFGMRNATDWYFNGSMSNVEMVDGQQYGPEYFGSFDSVSGIWTPQASSTISDYGTNGFKLKMDTTSPGADTSGKGNTFTASGTPTLLQGNPQNNWATWNVLQSQYFWGAAETSFATNGNTTLGSGTSQYGFISGTMGISKGKWYWETKINSETGGSQFLLGIASTMPRSATNHLGGNQYDYGMYSQNGNIYTSNASSSFAASYTVGDILSIAIDYDNAKLYFAKNGAWSTGSGAWGSSTFNAATGAKTITTPPPKPTATPGVGTGFYFPAFSYWDGANRGFISTNFGEGFFGTTAAGTNADGNGQGLFAYAVPSGYYALNTKNLEAYG